MEKNAAVSKSEKIKRKIKDTSRPEKKEKTKTKKATKTKEKEAKKLVLKINDKDILKEPKIKDKSTAIEEREVQGPKIKDEDKAKEKKGAKEEKSEADKPVNREKTCPLLLRVFCSTGRHHNIMDYSGKNVPANELQIYTWMDATLRELTGLVKEVNPEARRKGTYFEFALVTPDRGMGYRARDIGVTCTGQKGPDDNKTLAQVRFNIGDFMDISINPPNHMGMGRMGGGMGMGHGGGPMRRGRPY